MIPLRIFISSVQKELAKERVALRDYLEGDVLLRRFFEVFLFEDMPAVDQRVDDCYLEEVKKCDIYIGVFGFLYGSLDENGISPTQREFRLATELSKYRLIYVKGADDEARHPKMKVLIAEAGSSLIRRRFNSSEELISAVYISLIRLLEERELIRFSPFDASYCRNSTVADLDNEKISRFLGLARRGRSFPLPEDTSPEEVLIHLNLLDHGRPTSAAVLLFGKQPQRFLISSEVKCAHFHGVDVAKPIPSYQVYKGTVFDLVDQAKDFVLSKIDLWVGTRAESTQVPIKYEIPQEVVAEAIVNAVVHRDYTSNASVQVMLFKDRLEIWNPGCLPPNLTLEKLREPHSSVPSNPLLAEPMYLTKYIERMGTGIRDMIERCRNAGIAEPEIRIDAGFFVLTIQRTLRIEIKDKEIEVVHDGVEVVHDGVEVVHDGVEVVHGIQLSETMRQILTLLIESESSSQLLAKLGYPRRTRNYTTAINRLLSLGMLEMTLPEAPRSKKQQYRLTDKGQHCLKALKK